MLQTPLTVLKSSLADKPEDLCFENEVRYKLLIDHSEDESLVRFLFKFGILKRSNCRIYTLSKLPGDRLQKVSSVCNIHDNILYPAVGVLCYLFTTSLNLDNHIPTSFNQRNNWWKKSYVPA